MEIINSIDIMKKWHNKSNRVAFVPTMGGLHRGHLSLIELAKKNADKIVVSVFVNPTQFSENEDFSDYPRTFEKDLSLLEQYQVDVFFIPSVDDIYPDNKVFNQDEFSQDKDLFETLCGKTRPHFFYGVLQVVRRLFEIVQPDVAIFGQKDYQQLHVIKRFTSGVKIIESPIIRETNGLAMSTRNQYLSVNECKISTQLYKTLNQLKQGELDLNSATRKLQKYFKLDYLETLDANTLKKITDNTSKIAILCAVSLGSTRLIDNIIFNRK